MAVSILSLSPSGETQYDWSGVEDEDGRTTTSFQLEAGISPQLTVVSNASDVPVNGDNRQYTGFGFRTYWPARRWASTSVRGQFTYNLEPEQQPLDASAHVAQPNRIGRLLHPGSDPGGRIRASAWC